MSPKSDRYHLFLLGLWAESEAGEWRFSLENPRTAERTGFRNWDELTQFIQHWTHPKENEMTESQLKPTLLAPGSGQVFNALGVSLMLKTTSADSGGQWMVMEYTAPPHFSGPPPHYHKVMTEIFYVVEGQITFNVGEQTLTVGPGGYAFVPPRIMHSFSNQTDAPAKFFGIASPALLEPYLYEMLELVKGEPQWPPADMSKVVALMTKYDTFAPEAK